MYIVGWPNEPSVSHRIPLSPWERGKWNPFEQKKRKIRTVVLIEPFEHFTSPRLASPLPPRPVSLISFSPQPRNSRPPFQHLSVCLIRFPRIERLSDVRTREPALLEACLHEAFRFRRPTPLPQLSSECPHYIKFGEGEGEQREVWRSNVKNESKRPSTLAMAKERLCRSANSVSSPQTCPHPSAALFQIPNPSLTSTKSWRRKHWCQWRCRILRPLRPASQVRFVSNIWLNWHYISTAWRERRACKMLFLLIKKPFALHCRYTLIMMYKG